MSQRVETDPAVQPVTERMRTARMESSSRNLGAMLSSMRSLLLVSEVMMRYPLSVGVPLTAAHAQTSMHESPPSVKGAH